MDNEIKDMLNAIIEEIGDVEERMNRRFGKIDSKLESLSYEVSACKLERDSFSLLLKKIDMLEKRVEELEKKTA
ncbi:MAG: hypothetical protein Q4F41_09380 [Eubacteriales bacterium]|nr:hypothetical protein [Eubacteriales bacterium]